EQLEGFEAPAGHWENHLLPARLETYNSGWLDGLTFFGQVAWGRLRSSASLAAGKVANGAVGAGRAVRALTRSTPIALMYRDDADWLLPGIEENTDVVAVLGSNAGAVYEAFLRHGALFPRQLGALLQLVPAQVDDV